MLHTQEGLLFDNITQEPPLKQVKFEHSEQVNPVRPNGHKQKRCPLAAKQVPPLRHWKCIQFEG